MKKTNYTIQNVDAFLWLRRARKNSVHAVVTDPPYGLIEYEIAQLKKRANGTGVWRLPPAFDGAERRPLPRFSILSDGDKIELQYFFLRFAKLLSPVLVPGGHVFVASNPLLSHIVQQAFVEAGYECRGQIIRIVHRLRGGDRPKNAHNEFTDVSVLPKSCWEPWLLFRKHCQGRVQDNLRKWKTGGLRRVSNDLPFKDLIRSVPARPKEFELAPHPSLKPQTFLRQVVRASLPLGEGVILDPFMGAGSTIAAASALGLKSIGLELNPEFFRMAVRAIPKLAALDVVNGTALGKAPKPKVVRKPRRSNSRASRA